MSVNVELTVVEAGSDRLLEPAWELKQLIRDRDDVLKQRRRFFERAYKRSTCYVLRDPERDELIGFASVRSDGYLLFLAVAPDYRGEGLGESLVAQVAQENDRVTCHARTTNEDALAFYDHLGFDIVRRIDNYYEDSGDAYYLRLGDASGLLERLTSFVRGSRSDGR